MSTDVDSLYAAYPRHPKLPSMMPWHTILERADLEQYIDLPSSRRGFIPIVEDQGLPVLLLLATALPSQMPDSKLADSIQV